MLLHWAIPGYLVANTTARPVTERFGQMPGSVVIWNDKRVSPSAAPRVELARRRLHEGRRFDALPSCPVDEKRCHIDLTLNQHIDLTLNQKFTRPVSLNHARFRQPISSAINSRPVVVPT